MLRNRIILFSFHVVLDLLSSSRRQVRDAPFTADALEKRDPSSGRCKGRSSGLFRPHRLPDPSDQWFCCAAHYGIYSSGNCCRFSRHSLFIARTFLLCANLYIAKLRKKLYLYPRKPNIFIENYETCICISGTRCTDRRYG